MSCSTTLRFSTLLLSTNAKTKEYGPGAEILLNTHDYLLLMALVVLFSRFVPLQFVSSAQQVP